MPLDNLRCFSFTVVPDCSWNRTAATAPLGLRYRRHTRKETILTGLNALTRVVGCSAEKEKRERHRCAES